MGKFFNVSVLLIFAFLTSCKTIKTQAPSAVYEPVIVKPELSSINIPLEIQTKKLETIINSYLVGTLYEDNNINDDDLVLKVSKLSNISLEVVGEEFRFKVPLRVWIKAGFKVE